MLGAPFFQPGYVCGYYAPGISGTVNTFHVIPVLYAWDDEADSIVLDAALFAVSPRTPPPTIRLLLVLSRLKIGVLGTVQICSLPIAILTTSVTL